VRPLLPDRSGSHTNETRLRKEKTYHLESTVLRNMTIRELEEVNDQLQVQIEQLKEQLLNAPPPELEDENEHLRAEIERLKEQLREKEEQRASLSEMVRSYQLNRQNELLQLESERKAVADLREIELNRLNQASREVAQEKAQVEEERKRVSKLVEQERMQSRELAAELEVQIEEMQEQVQQANTTSEGWKRQVIMATDRMNKAETARSLADGNLSLAKSRIESLESNNRTLSRRCDHLLENPPKPRWMQLIEILSANPGWVFVGFLAILLLSLALYIVGLIFQSLMH